MSSIMTHKPDHDRAQHTIDAPRRTLAATAARKSARTTKAVTPSKRASAPAKSTIAAESAARKPAKAAKASASTPASTGTRAGAKQSGAKQAAGPSRSRALPLTNAKVKGADGLSINACVAPLVDALIADAARLRVRVSKHATGATIVDAGIEVPGGIEAGLRIIEICMGGLGSAQIAAQHLPAVPGEVAWSNTVVVRSSLPVLSCLASQYAGWSLNHGEGKEKFRAMGSGPARALAVKEDLYEELRYQDHASRAVLVLEVDKVPPKEIIDKVCKDCGVPASALTIILTPTTSLAGMTQIVGRVLEVAMHKAHELHFPLENIVDGVASAPLPPPSADFLTSMSRSNDAILFAGHVQLFVHGDDESARQLAEHLPSSASRDYGKPFGELFKACGYDFYKIDPHLFAPAQVLVTALDSGNSFAAGRRDDACLATAFGGEAVRAGGRTLIA